MSEPTEITLNGSVIEELEDRFTDALREPIAGHWPLAAEVLTALMTTMGRQMVGIPCPSCRELTYEQIMERLPSRLREAMRWADDNTPPPEEHRH